MRIRNSALVIGAACLGLSACHLGGIFGSKAPTGQIAATVDGKEVTLTDLNAELGGEKISDPKEKKLAEQRALQSIIVRKLLANEAQKEGVDKTPNYVIQRQRTEETILAQALEQKIASEVPPTTLEEANQYVQSHPESFANRKLFGVSQLRTPANIDASLAAQLKPMRSLAEVQKLLTDNKIPFQAGNSALDTVSMDKHMIDAITATGPNDIFILRADNLTLINHLEEVRPAPLTGAAANNAAVQALHQKQVREIVSRRLGGVLEASKTKVQYNPDFAPPKVSAGSPRPAAPAK